MFEHFDTQSLISVMTSYGYVAVFPLSFLLGPIIVVVAGLMVSMGYFNPVVMFFALLAGDLAGDTLCYGIGYWGGRAFAKRWGGYVGISEEKIETAGREFTAYGWQILLFGKTQVTGLPTGLALLVAAGVFEMPYWIFLWWNAVGSVVKIILLEALGIYFGRSFVSVSGSAFTYATYAFLIIAALFVLIPFVSKRYLLKKPPEGK
jgi:membrane protein DedA with SNARE-associated domain